MPTRPIDNEHKACDAVARTWTDMSDYLVHFAKDYEGKNAYDNILGILSNRVIRACNRIGLARTHIP